MASVSPESPVMANTQPIAFSNAENMACAITPGILSELQVRRNSTSLDQGVFGALNTTLLSKSKDLVDRRIRGSSLHAHKRVKQRLALVTQLGRAKPMFQAQDQLPKQGGHHVCKIVLGSHGGARHDQAAEHANGVLDARDGCIAATGRPTEADVFEAGAGAQC